MYNNKYVSAVICAAGMSSRMKSDKNKQLLEFGGMTVIERTVNAFMNDDVCDEIIIVYPEIYKAEFCELFEKRAYEKPVKLTAGGAERQISVKNGVDAADEKSQLIAVHDGARPFVTPELIHNVVADGCAYGCAALAVPVKDTIKRVRNGVVVDTPPRDELAAVQTPQVFYKKTYLEAYEYAERSNIICTDDCRLMELYGKEVHITMGSYNNIKITTPEDIAAANSIVEAYNLNFPHQYSFKGDSSRGR